MGAVYLICFDEPLGHARHYLGYTSKAVSRRLEEHRSGRGARLMEVVTERGISWQHVRTWTKDPDTGRPANRATEKKLKLRRNAARLCPRCRREKYRRQYRLDLERRNGRPRLSHPWALSPEEREERKKEMALRCGVVPDPTEFEAFDEIPF